mmetsp:Transcript_53867/g.99557  ORF Transcript_53867/g.99557 Transcript_53867/m.99557 type:complete len:327 (-) Transcript_53867:15-995(-)
MAAVAPAALAAMTTSLAASSLITTNSTTTMTTTALAATREALECSQFFRYPGYTGAMNVSGKIIMVDQSPSYTQDVYWLLDGVDPACMVAAASDNQCGIRLLEGTSCAQPEGKNLYNHKLSFEDPWTGIHYDTALGSARSSNKRGQTVSTGYALSDLAGHAMVIFDSVFPGEAAACCMMHSTSLQNVSWTALNNGGNFSNVTIIANVKPVAITRRPWWVVVVWCLAIIAIVALMCFALPCCGVGGEEEQGEDGLGSNPVEKGKGLAKKVKEKLRRRAEESEDRDTESRQPLTEGPPVLEEETRRSQSRPGKKSSTSCFPKVSPCAA